LYTVEVDLRQDVVAWTGFIWFRIGTSEGGGCPVKFREILEQLSDWQLLKEDSDPWG
jgi:hypothetical protein